AGSKAWKVGVADPAKNTENDRPLAELALSNKGVATSGNYARYVEVAGRRRSGMIDPRTGRTADDVAGATVVAGDAITADALATAFSVMGPQKALALVQQLDGVECLLVDAAGKQYSSKGWAALVESKTSAQALPAAANWPDGYKMTLTFSLGPAQRPRNYKRPYVAAWIEDGAGKHVKTLAVWGSKDEWRRDLRSWYRLGARLREQARDVTRASRPAGQYSLVWDGKDQAGKAVKPGKYTVRLEIVREDAGRVDMKAAIECGDKPAKATMPANAECGGGTITYGS
ncbi:MAG TPA: DUF2271 domain-containing protein, partial [Phycisphaerae bacterium]|nr:DUF2271 domain-containing protein [Phycisphaerae bacterium]